MTSDADHNESVAGLDWRGLIEVGRDLYLTGLVTSHGGNLSLERFGGGALITRTGGMLGHLSEADLVPINGGGQRDRREDPEPSSNTAVHLAIYANQPEAKAVIHAHAVYTVAVCERWEAIDPPNVEGKRFLGRVPVLDLQVGEEALPVAEALRERRIVAVRGHGTFAWGTDIWDALRVTSALEESSQLIHLRGVTTRPPPPPA
ncbi:MAG: hypothetical protein GEU80_05350 [Dehalococcoidia bacterium]|nr:hypothetical protein [Dehalococcoidia bacterium]